MSTFCRDRAVPKAVEIEPILADKLGARIFGKRMLGGDIFGPASLERAGGWVPRVGKEMKS